MDWASFIGIAMKMPVLTKVIRDLKPENLLLDENNDIKIVDFGLSNTYKPGELLKTACGSPCYAAPEMIAGLHYEPHKVDIWSSGIILFALICGQLPFEDSNTGNLYKKIKNGDYSISKFVSSQGRDLIKHILDTNPETRYSFEEIMTHPWFQQIAPEINISEGSDPSKEIQVDPVILAKSQELGLDAEIMKEDVISNKHNHYTTT